MSRRKYTTFLSLLYASFLETYGPAVGSLGTLITIVAWFFLPPTVNWKDQCWILQSAATCWLFFILLHAAWIAFARKSLPKVVSGSLPPKGVYGVAFLLLEQGEAFSYDTMVAIFIEDAGWERQIGTGKVSSIQENGRVQVHVVEALGGYDTFWKQISANDADRLKQIIVKPYVSASLHLPMTVKNV